MKKKLFVAAVCVLTMAGLTACGGSSVSYDKYDLDEYIKVGEYKGLTVAGYEVEVTDDEIDTRIEQELEEAASSQEVAKGSPVKEGDTVNIDYVGKKDGKKFDGGSAEGYDLEIGSGSFIDGFEDGLIGKKIGDKVKLELTFPEDYGEASLAGQDVVFNVTINSATRMTVPEYDLDYVKNTTEYDSIAAYEKAVEKEIYKEKEAEEISNQQTELWSKVLEDTEVIQYPEKELDYYIQFNSDQMDDMAEQYGVSREDMLANYDFGSEEEFAAVNEDSSKLRVKQEMLIEYIADKEELKYTDEEAEEMIASFEQMGYDEEMVKSQTGHDMDSYVRIELLYQKVLEFLLDNAKIK